MGTQWIVGASVVLLVIYATVVFNRLIRQRNVVREGWKGIDVQLRRRTDLVPNLVETVKAHAAHERGLFEELSERRARSIAASDVGGQAAAERALASSLCRLMALADAYPQLESDKNFLHLQDELAHIEDQIQTARRYYNGAVRYLNASIQSFPELLLARALGFKEQPFLELEDRAEAAEPRVGLVTLTKRPARSSRQT
jgi:LemA protein